MAKTSWNIRQAALRLVFELGPAVVFFAATKIWGIYAGTIALMASAALSTVVSWYRTRRIPVMPLAGLGLTLLFGGMTLWWRDDQFIKMQPTLVNGISALVLAGALAVKKLPLKAIFGAGTHARTEAWRTLTLALVAFLTLLAVMNEIMWRAFPTDTWAAYKAFVIPTLDGLFVAGAYKYLRANRLDAPEAGDLTEPREAPEPAG
ncbi:inner membrane-spanning protein YciB [Caenispirillum bisanense]|uniref:Inner membrane-spanning protein YciB n=1 Tax=Caenispirillum bisanense TaxID=414052 RepID=A0A286G635_9PROT|nr:septation protein IspZ [Caenispirillum bisanense]SOD91020.1 intracellular septation protein [Caenispirillum bisanense]